MEELPAVAPLVGRPAHGRVGVAQQFTGRHPVARVDRDSHAEGEEELVPPDLDGLSECGEETTDGGGRFGGPRRPRQQRGQRAAAEVRERVLGAPRVLQAPPEVLEELVGVLVSERRLHGVEPVDAEHGHGEGQALARGVLDRLAYPVLEKRAVGEAGDRVVQQQVAHLLFAVLLAGAVDDHARGADDHRRPRRSAAPP